MIVCNVHVCFTNKANLIQDEFAWQKEQSYLKTIVTRVNCRAELWVLQHIDKFVVEGGATTKCINIHLINVVRYQNRNNNIFQPVQCIYRINMILHLNNIFTIFFLIQTCVFPIFFCQCLQTKMWRLYICETEVVQGSKNMLFQIHLKTEQTFAAMKSSQEWF